MTQKSEQEGKLSLNRPGRLELKKTVETGQVRQSFSHGRSKSVMVEVKKKRTFGRDSAGKMRAVSEEQVQLPETPIEEEDLGNLTEQERAARMRAIHGAAEEAEKRRIDELEDERRRVEEENKRRAQEEEEARRRADDDARRKAEEEVRQRAEQEANRRVATEADAGSKKADNKEAESAKPQRRAKPDTKRPRRSKDEPRRRMQGKLTIGDALRQAEDGDEGRVRSLAAIRRAQEREKKRQRAELQKGEVQQQVREVVVPESITVSDLANRMATRAADVVKVLMNMGVMAAANQTIDADTAELVVNEMGHKVKRVSEADVEIGLEGTEDQESDLDERAPVVTVMGHVDHGKTSLLDVLRESDVAGGEAGGITQHIGAYRVNSPSGAAITFLDTPGHEAFTEMRARGASVTDIVILVVAADDGVQPQTVEAISHAKAAEVPIIVAINKVDTPGADSNRVRNELLNHEIVVESLGGDVLDVEVSAKEKTNIDKLEEAILLQSEILELKANPNRLAQGVVVEAKMEQARGSVATVLVERGTLRTGDIFVAGSEWGRVRAMIDDRGTSVKEAGPAHPVEVLGLQGTPSAGDTINVVEDEARAREIAEYRTRQLRQTNMAAGARGTLEQMFDKIKTGESEELEILIKTDVQGSLEAINSSLQKLETDEARVRVLHSGVGGITESDVILARASEGVIIGFNVRANPQARELAKRDNVDIRYYSIIYDVIDDMKKLMSGLLAPEMREKQLGYAEIRQVFGISKVGKIGGCMVTEGEVKRGARVRLLRDDVVIHEGSLKTLRRFKDDVRDVQQGYECGMAFENYDDIKEGDMVECYEVEEISRSL
ncbi:MAG TPA: translation initiation factor IF-2 [Rhodospirillaceae bacterium]|nr:translation initiation factor IF-2 [Rhodospirillaceae bacterium]